MTLTERISFNSLIHGANAAIRLASLANRVLNGAVFIYPTETIYGIGGRADSKAVEQRIRSIKERSKPSPFIVIAADKKNFRSLHLNFTPKAELLARKFWPGNITLILPSPNAPDGVGVRVSDHPFIAALFSALGVPIFSTSANISDQPYKNDPDEIFNVFNGKVDFMVDAGILPESKPSTVVRITKDDSVEILREGVVLEESVLKCLEIECKKTR
jgi:L-threonylcarbamoyladenylate synthase